MRMCPGFRPPQIKQNRWGDQTPRSACFKIISEAYTSLCTVLGSDPERMTTQGIRARIPASEALEPHAKSSYKMIFEYIYK
jgi:hypothetical protein